MHGFVKLLGKRALSSMSKLAHFVKDVDFGVRLVQVVAWRRSISFEAAQLFVNQQSR